MTMTKEEMIRQAAFIRQNDRFGPVAQKELQALSGTQQMLTIPLDNGRTVTVYELRPSDGLPPDAPMIINYHGGGFIKGRTDRDHRYCSFLLERLSCLIWDVDYCLAPEEPFPAAVHDCYGVAAYAFSHARELGVDPARIAMAGHSAGGNLVAAGNILDSDLHQLAPCALLIEYAPADHTKDPLLRLPKQRQHEDQAIRRAERERLYQQFYCRDEERADPLCSPIKATHAQLSGFPDCLVISAGQDSLRDETETFARKLMEAGVTVTARRFPNSIHGFTTNRTEGWEEALALHCQFFLAHFLKSPDTVKYNKNKEDFHS